MGEHVKQGIKGIVVGLLKPADWSIDPRAYINNSKPSRWTPIAWDEFKCSVNRMVLSPSDVGRCVYHWCLLYVSQLQHLDFPVSDCSAGGLKLKLEQGLLLFLLSETELHQWFLSFFSLWLFTHHVLTTCTVHTIFSFKQYCCCCPLLFTVLKKENCPVF